jgi:hypothetical protein
MKKPGTRTALAALGAGALICLLGLVGLFRGLDGKCYDLLLGLRGAEPPARELLLVDVDRDAIAAEGLQPWSGERLAAGLSLLVEFDSNYVALNLPPGRAGPGEVDAAALRALPGSVETELEGIKKNIGTLFDGIRLGSVPPAEASRAIAELLGLVDGSEARLLGAVAGVSGPGEGDFREWARLQGKTFIARDLDPLSPDEDGVLRRASVLRDKGSAPELLSSLSALQGRLGWPEPELRRGSLFLKDARLPGARPRELRLPLGADGRLLLSFRRQGGKDDFRRISWAELSRTKALEGRLMEELRGLEPSVPPEARGAYASLLDRRSLAEETERELLSGADASRLAEWRATRAAFFEEARAFLAANFPNSEAMGSYEALSALRASLAREIPGSFCLVSLATPETGRLPSGERASQSAVQAALADSILRGSFLREIPRRFSLWGALALSLLVALATLYMRPKGACVLGLGLGAGTLAASAVLFLGWGIYLAPVAPFLAALATAAVLGLLSPSSAPVAQGL